jgi:hypothetical protein
MLQLCVVMTLDGTYALLSTSTLHLMARCYFTNNSTKVHYYIVARRYQKCVGKF